jgi:hypothetical protein
MIGFLVLGLFFVAVCVAGVVHLIAAPRALAIRRLA